MPRIRSIKPEFWEDEKLARELTIPQRLAYIALWNMADDYGRFRPNPRKLLGDIFPYDRSLSGDFLEDLVRVLRDTRRIVLYEHDGELWAELTKFREHQRISHPSKENSPRPDDPKSIPVHDFPPSPEILRKSSGNPPEGLQRHSTLEQGAGSREQGAGSTSSSGESDDSPTEAGAARAVLLPAELERPGGRMKANELLGVWIDQHPDRAGLSPSTKAKQGAPAKAICAEYSRAQIVQAIVGMPCLFQFRPDGGSPWDLFDLRKFFHKALEAAYQHPEIASQRRMEEILQALN